MTRPKEPCEREGPKLAKYEPEGERENAGPKGKAKRGGIDDVDRQKRAQRK